MKGVCKNLARLLHDVVALIYPPQCHLCFGVEVSEHCRFICEPCWQRITNETLPRLRASSLLQPLEIPISNCDFDLAAWHYRGTMQMLIPQMKYHNAHPSFAKIFGALAAQRMAPVLEKWLTPQTFLLPVPLHPVRQRERGFNQSELIARAFAAEWQLELLPRALVRTRYTKQQARFVDRDARLNNVHAAFAVRRNVRLEGSEVILIDDVITSGATMSACAQVLRAAGAKSVGAVALARGGGTLMNFDDQNR